MAFNCFHSIEQIEEIGTENLTPSSRDNTKSDCKYDERKITKCYKIKKGHTDGDISHDEHVLHLNTTVSFNHSLILTNSRLVTQTYRIRN